MVRGYASPARQAGADQQEGAGADARQPSALCRCIAQPICCRRVCNLSSSAAGPRHEDDIDSRRFAIGRSGITRMPISQVMGRLRSAIGITRSLGMPLIAAVNTSHGPSEIHLLRTIEKQDVIVPAIGVTPGSGRYCRSPNPLRSSGPGKHLPHEAGSCRVPSVRFRPLDCSQV